MGKNRKRSHTEISTEAVAEEPALKKRKWVNKQRVLVFCSRGINYANRHLMEDLKKLMPHHKPESKMERSKTLSVVNEMCEMKNCNKALMFEGRKKMDLYLWMANVPNGPSAKFLVESAYTMDELKLSGNCLRGSRPLLSFDPSFEKYPHYTLMKELLTQIFGVPKHHPKSQPFFDHVYTFTVLDNRIWFRNFQILSEDGALTEIGPRFVLNPVKIFSGSFGGVALWENPNYVSPSKYRQQIRLKAKDKYVHRVQQKEHKKLSQENAVIHDQAQRLDDIFEDNPLKMAKKITKKLSKKTVNGESAPNTSNKASPKKVPSKKYKAKKLPSKKVGLKQKSKKKTSMK